DFQRPHAEYAGSLGRSPREKAFSLADHGRSEPRNREAGLCAAHGSGGTGGWSRRTYGGSPSRSGPRVVGRSTDNGLQRIRQTLGVPEDHRRAFGPDVELGLQELFHGVDISFLKPASNWAGYALSYSLIVHLDHRQHFGIGSC